MIHDLAAGPGFLAAAMVLLTISAASALLGPRTEKVALMLAALGSGALAGLGILVAIGPPVRIHLGAFLGMLDVDLSYELLAAPFLIALGIVGTAASIYAAGHRGSTRSRLDGVAYPTFLMSLGLLFGSETVLAFLIAWEGMALTSAALVVGPNPEPTTVRAGYVYLALTHLASAALVIAFAILVAATGHTDFTSIREAAGAVDPAARDFAFVLLLLGFGTKAGLVPLHVWLPRAHPAAPSHVSALMSGVMVTAGVFGMLRIAVDVLGPGPAWWALVVIVMAAGSAVLGALYALVERDLKRLLAFSTIENVGIMFLGIGVGLLGTASGLRGLAALGIAAALVHMLNHAAFKGLLFLGAGSIQSATGLRDLDRLGGLIRVMPWTGALFMIGGVAMAGVPPFGGFAGEWLTFQALITAGANSGLDALIRFACLVAVGALALSAALALAAIVKAMGVGLLALPRSGAAERATEVGWMERGGGVVLALVALAAAVFTGGLRSFAGGVADASIQPTPTSPNLSPPVVLGPYEPLGLIVLIALIGGIAWAFVRWRALPTRRVPTWACGIAPTAAHEYTATSFDKPARLFFEPILQSVRSRTVELVPGTPFPHRVTFRSSVDHVVESRIYVPLHRAAIAFSQTARRLQQGTLQLYVAYMVVAVLFLLVVTRS